MTEIKGYGESAEANTSAAPAAAGTAAPSATDLLPVAEEAYRLLKSGSDYCSAQAAEARRLIDKMKAGEITVAVIGQFKRGKSSLSNRILGADVMPVGIIPITSAVTTVRYGEPSATVHFKNGASEEIGFDDLSDYISEQKNAGNKLGVKEVALTTKSDFLKNGLTYVDTPGVGSFNKLNTETAYDQMKESDAVIFLLSVDSPINQIEVSFLYNTREFAGKFYFAVNKIDVVSKEDLDEYITYCRDLLSDLMGTDDIHIFPVSAATGEGVEDLKNAILEDCRNQIREIMRESTRKKLDDMVIRALKQLRFYWNAMKMSYEDLDEKFDAINKFTAEKKVEARGYDSMFEVHLNELKIELAAKIDDLFGMQYGFEIDELPPGMVTMKKEDYLADVDELCDSFINNLKTILMYREENAFVVVRRIEDLNKLTRRLRGVETRLARM